ncbi:protein of unknown function [Candidatus Nitrotoga arctica]|uniref:Uncharacterized protein n=1 Tax=Candidatus Nitrotoga arctica TaxID=453162 RepID=A0ABM8Z0W1_9PROT|nr:protein of unknown function [Candidatus Nitrotoga arctica]
MHDNISRIQVNTPLNLYKCLNLETLIYCFNILLMESKLYIVSIWRQYKVK